MLFFGTPDGLLLFLAIEEVFLVSKVLLAFKHGEEMGERFGMAKRSSSEMKYNFVNDLEEGYYRNA